jgi:hypothetical protein
MIGRGLVGRASLGDRRATRGSQIGGQFDFHVVEQHRNNASVQRIAQFVKVGSSGREKTRAGVRAALGAAPARAATERSEGGSHSVEGEGSKEDTTETPPWPVHGHRDGPDRTPQARGFRTAAAQAAAGSTGATTGQQSRARYGAHRGLRPTVTARRHPSTRGGFARGGLFEGTGHARTAAAAAPPRRPSPEPRFSRRGMAFSGGQDGDCDFRQ